jgi:hypothetical protein
VNSELDKLRKETTREEFISEGASPKNTCPSDRFGLSDYWENNRKCGHYTSPKCIECYTEAVKDIQFKDDIEILEVLTDGKKEELSTIKDSGYRTQFESGAVRDLQENKGRADLMALEPIQAMLNSREITYINNYIETGDIQELYNALFSFSDNAYSDVETMFLEVSKHYEEGAKKYSINNWCKGIPTHSYIDSAIRHYLKHRRGDKDESHDRAFVWNIMCCIWTHINKPEMRDILPKVKSHD